MEKKISLDPMSFIHGLLTMYSFPSLLFIIGADLFVAGTDVLPTTTLPIALISGIVIFYFESLFGEGSPSRFAGGKPKNSWDMFLRILNPFPDAQLKWTFARVIRAALAGLIISLPFQFAGFGFAALGLLFKGWDKITGGMHK